MTDVPTETDEVAIHRGGVWPLVTAAEMQALDRRTIDERGVAGEILMESAGRALIAPALELMRASMRHGAPLRAICGAGNNGGDGFVLARHLHAEGVAVEVVLVGDPRKLPRDAAANWRRLEVGGVPRQTVEPGAASLDWRALFDRSSVAVDALFGTGLVREIGGGHAAIVEAMNAARHEGLLVLSVDVPSGIAANTGRILGSAVEADRTVTISLPKIGLALEPGRGHAGRISVARVGIDDPAPDRTPRVELWNARAAARLFPARPRDGHKGRFGHVLVVAGSPGKMGAAALCSRAASRSGAGLVTLAHARGREAELPGLPVEAMSESVASTSTGALARAAEKAIEELAVARDGVALGPGIGRDPETVDLVRRLVGTIDRPMVIDADGLNALQGHLGLLVDRGAATVLTPHPGEAARLLETDTSRIAADRVAAARAIAEASGAAVVLKGAGTVVADPSGRTLIVPTGGPNLAAGGSGDVLTGVVAALLVAGRPAFEAAGLAAWWHGAAADRAARDGADFGLLASELADALPATAREIAAQAAEEQDEDLDLRFPGP